jgi:unsaturated rhamnogalacturonyl hydrolase
MANAGVATDCAALASAITQKPVARFIRMSPTSLTRNSPEQSQSLQQVRWSEQACALKLVALAVGLCWVLSCTPAQPAAKPTAAPGDATASPGAPAQSPTNEMTPAIQASPGWEGVDAILARIAPPTFPDRDCVITDYGAKAGGTSDATVAIQRAISACSAAGGGRVVVPPGVFSTGAIHLDSNINLHVSEGATLSFQTNPDAYLPVVLTRWEGIECMNYSPLIYALDEENLAITGRGTLDGGASEDNWWKWAKKDSTGSSMAKPDAKELNRMSERGIPVAERVFGDGHYLRPNFIQFYRSRNILVENVTLLHSPMWEIHPVLSTNVTVRGVTVRSHGPNNDGCNPDSSTDVLIDGCVFDVGDDCIAIKSGRNEDGRRVARPVENVMVRNSTMKDGHAGVAIGSEVAGDARNIFIENNRMDSPNLERALRLKSNARRGGVIENVYMRNVEVGQVSEALLTIDFMYEEGDRGAFPPTARNIVIDGVTARNSPRLFYILGFEAATIEGIRVSNTHIQNATATEIIEHAGKIELDNVAVSPAERPRSLSSRPAAQ